MDIKLIITDIDGVWTDGGMYYTGDGKESRKFNTSDSVGVLLAKAANIEILVLTGEDDPSVKKRVQKLKVHYYHPGINNKLHFVEKFIKKKNLDFDKVAFVGDEINDHSLLKKVGFSGCPQSAPLYTRNMVDYVIPTDGGSGAFRDFVIEIFTREGNIEQLLRQLAQDTCA